MFVDERRLRPHFLQFHRCEQVLVEDLTLRDAPFCLVHPVLCTDVTVRGISCISEHINSDGVDPDSSRRVLVENCNFVVGDDGVAIKSGRDQDSWRVGIPSEDIVIGDCRYSGSTSGAVVIGSVMSGGVRNVWIENWQLPRCNHAFYFEADLDCGGLIQDVFVRNIAVGTAAAAIIFTNDYHSYRGGNYPPRFERVAIGHLVVGKAEYGLAIQGHPSAPVRDIHTRNVVIGEAANPFQMSHGETVVLETALIGGRLVAAADSAPWEAGTRH